MKIWIGLENTVIKSLDDPVFINADALSWMLRSSGARSVEVFSPAIATELDRRRFEESVRPQLEANLGVTITRCLALDEILAELKLSARPAHERDQLVALLGREKLFQDFCRATQVSDCMLIDGAVMNSSTFFVDLNLVVHTMNVAMISTMIGDVNSHAKMIPTWPELSISDDVEKMLSLQMQGWRCVQAGVSPPAGWVEWLDAASKITGAYTMPECQARADELIRQHRRESVDR